MTHISFCGGGQVGYNCCRIDLCVYRYRRHYERDIIFFVINNIKLRVYMEREEKNEHETKRKWNRTEV